ncbi:MAG: RNA polymerase sigma-54 factor [Nitrospirae bacterium]|nr:MAG: RNA polymerase sigma-54 factor [Nitrospirota bacterium]
MTMQPRLDLRLSQRLIMTPQLQQAIKLLQLSRLELQEALTQQMEENPMLEEAGTELEDPDAEAGVTEVASETTKSEERGEEPVSAEAGGEEAARNDLAGSWDEYFDDDRKWGDIEAPRNGRDELPSFEQTTAKTTSLEDHLLWQLALSPLDKIEQEIGKSIIGNLDEGGYLRMPLEELAAESGMSFTQATRVLQAIQAFDPVGVAARDLRECLLAQIEQLSLGETLAEAIIRNHLPDLERKRYPAIAKALGVSVDAVVHATKVIEGLEPKPGRPFFTAENHAIIPDVYVVKSDGQWVVMLNDDGMPKFRISSSYRHFLAGKRDPSDATRAFLDEKFRSAQWLIRSIEQRNKTIVRVVESIVKVQEPFFEHGIQYLRPMVLRDVAEDVSMHESTISRVTSNKYLNCSQGIFELKFFFNTSIPRSQEGLTDLSSVAVREMIRKMVGEEDDQQPLKDQEIVARLKAQNVILARRTVAKYRMELNIPPASRRKRAY